MKMKEKLKDHELNDHVLTQFRNKLYKLLT